MRITGYIIFILALILPEAGYSYDISTDAAYYKKWDENFDASKYSDQIKQVEEFLSGFNTLESRFNQISPEGRISQGKVYIMRPGKARWDYETPEETRLVIRDGRLMYYDKELDQVSYGDVPQTPVTVLLTKDIKFSGDIKVVNLRDDKDSLSITAAPVSTGDEESFESLTFAFLKSPLRLVRIHRTDSNNNTITMTLLQPKYDVKLKDDVFTLSNPKFVKEN